jgi:methylmalonyl-CoA mutase N-terminal domain/subunit
VANDYIRQIEKLGGMIPAIEAGFPQSEIAGASYRYQREVEKGERVIVGANRFQSDDHQIEILQIDQSAQKSQEEKVKNLRARRNNLAVQNTLDALSRAAEGTENTMPYIINAVRAYATLGEICDTLRNVFGTYTEATHL